MIVVRARNVHQALPLALDRLRAVGVKRDSRNGPVVMFPEPVTTVYLKPAERVIFWAERDANPFFHLVESLWMLGGRNDVAYVSKFVERMKTFSDDGKTFHGAYGYRWRHHFGIDQLPVIIEALKADPTDRRQVLSMWDANADLGRVGKDLPCNLQAIFQIAPDGRLDMMVTNRSNDMVWGAYGANAVHFSYLHEYMARSIGVEQGIYWQVSANFHAYEATLAGVEALADTVDASTMVEGLTRRSQNPYSVQVMLPYPLMSIDRKDWDEELEMFLENPNAIGYTEPFFKHVAIPMVRTHAAYKDGGPERFAKARAELIKVDADDWRFAAAEWLDRREAAAAKRFTKANDDGANAVA